MLKIVAQCDKCQKQIALHALTLRGAMAELQKSNTFVVTQPAEIYCEDCAKHLGLLVRCPGEAHIKGQGGGFIDHCPDCGPRWGWVEASKQAVKS